MRLYRLDVSKRCPANAGAMNISALQKVTDWLIDGARSATTPSLMMSETCERLVAGGIAALARRRLHSHAASRRIRPWLLLAAGKRGGGDGRGFRYPGFAEYRNSPLAILYDTEREVRFRLDDPASRGFPFFDDMRAEGVTDYIALPLWFVGEMHASSWTTKQPGGFSDRQLDALRSLVPPLARVIEIVSLSRKAATLLDTYVGNRAGERILGGQIRRGHTETMRAVIWLSDLRGFTALSDRLAPEIVVDILNRYFDCQVPAIRKHGGEVLKFMGDGLLAVFPIAEDESNTAEVCGRVLQAARESRASVEELSYDNGETVERFRFGVALHVGRILFGNIGGGNRLDFTCIGPAVNLAARLEKIAGRLKRIVVASEQFAGICGGGWTDLGEFPIAGFARAERVYGLADETAEH